ncbi:MAG: PAS domain S-box protein [Marinilabiliaceae bacterium]|nr:PAS domain S-box protein [Marinilabiliaceae bacterium]
MTYNLSHILDFKKIKKLLESYTKASGLACSLLDHEGNILCKSGWQRICAEFHRVHSETLKNCRISDIELAKRLESGGKFNVYKCLNGLIDVAVPITVYDQHVGNLSAGQFFFERPDVSFFKKQARKYGFDEKEYLSVVSQVPVLSEADIRKKLDFLLMVTEMIAEFGLLKVKEAQSKERLQKSEEKYRKLFENLNEGFALHEIITDANGQAVDYRYLEVNPEFERITGLKAEYVVGKTEREVLPGTEDDHANRIGRFGEVALHGKKINFEDYSKELDTWFLINGFCPKPGQFAVTFTDISKRKMSEEQLIESENKFRALIEQSITGIYIFSKEKFLYVNQKLCDIFGYSREEFLTTKKPTDVIQKEDRQKVQKYIDDRFTGKSESAHYFARGKRKDNKELWVEIHGSTMVLAGEPVITGTLLDVTAQYLASAKMQESELKFRSLFEQVGAGVAIIDSATGKFQDVNQKLCAIMGYPMEEFLQLDHLKIVYPDDLEKYLLNMDKLGNGTEHSFTMEMRYFHKSGSVVWVILHFARLWLMSKAPKYYVAICEDITLKKQAEKEIINSEKRFRSVVEQSLTGIYIFDKEKFIYVNKQFAEIFGYSETEILDTVKPVDLLALDERDAAKERVRQRYDNERKSVRYVAQGICKDKRSIWVEVQNGSVEIDDKVLISGTVLDVTEKIRAENALKKQNNYLSILKELVLMVMQSKSIDEVIRFALLKLRQLIGCEAAFIKQFTNDFSGVSILNVDTSYEVSMEQLNGLRGKLTKEALGKLKKGELLLRNDWANHPAELSDSERILFTQGVRASLTVPMFMREGLFGILEVNANQTNFFSNEDRELVESISHNLAMGIDKILLDVDLKNYTKQLEEAQRIGHIGSCEFDPDTGKGSWSKELYRILGFEVFQFAPDKNHLMEAVVPEDKEFVEQKLLEAQTSNVPVSFEFQIKHTDKNPHIVSAYIEAQRDPQGHLIKLLGSFQDVTENKLIMSALEERDATYEMLFDTAPDGILIADANSRYLNANPAMCTMLGYAKEEIIGFHATDIVSPLEYENIDPALDRVKSMSDYHREWQFKRKDGSQFSAEVLAKTMPDGNIMAMVRDTTERKIAENRIRKMNIELEARVEQRTAQLESLNNELRAFTHSVSHDLKTPLRGINGYSKLLLNMYGKSLNEEGRLFVDNIINGTEQMAQLIDDLLDYSRLERASLNFVRVDVSTVINGVLELNREEITRHGIKIDLNFEPLNIVTDRNALTIAFRNLIENAIKFSKNEKQPVIQIHQKETADMWVWAIKDNGIGFEMKFYDKIFRIFERLHHLEEYEGTGIGLALVKKAMTRIGGTVSAESILGEGATFYLQIPKS